MDDLGTGKFNLGVEQRDENLPMVAAGMDTKTMPFPTDKTCDAPPANEDGGTGKPFVKTLDSRRGKADSGNKEDRPSMGGPNAQ